MSEPLAQATPADAPLPEPVAPTATTPPSMLHPVEEQEHQIVVDEVSISAGVEAMGADYIREKA